MLQSAAINIDLLEIELKKRLQYPYHWGRMQNNDWDKSTAFIYSTYNFDNLIIQIDKYFKQLKVETAFEDFFNYSINRWYNFWSAKGIEHLFTALPKVLAHGDTYDKQIDFWIDGIPFDHKTSIFPKAYKKPIDEAVKTPSDLTMWLYQNQSHQGREHFKNRLFVVLYQKNGDHWQLKAELNLIKKYVEKYVQNFKVENLINHSFKASENTTLTDVIFIIK